MWHHWAFPPRRFSSNRPLNSALHLAMRKGDSSALPVKSPLPSSMMLQLRTTAINGELTLRGESLPTSLRLFINKG